MPLQLLPVLDHLDVLDVAKPTGRHDSNDCACTKIELKKVGHLTQGCVFFF